MKALKDVRPASPRPAILIAAGAARAPLPDRKRTCPNRDNRANRDAAQRAHAPLDVGTAPNDDHGAGIGRPRHAPPAIPAIK